VHLIYRSTCRICGSKALSPVIDLGEQYLQGAFVKEGHIDPPRRKLPTQLLRCDVTRNEDGCGLLQLAHTPPPQILYSNYWYRSGTNATMRQHLAGIVESALSLCENKVRRVVDIGCNDGTLLKCYPESVERFGVDPSDIASEIAAPVTVIDTVFPSAKVFNLIEDGSVDVITSIAMYYDLDDPLGFTSSIKRLLSPEGVWIVEMSYLPLMLQTNSFDTICHEHLEYYSLSVLENIMARVGLRIFRAELNEINGGSIRCYVCHDTNFAFDTPEASKHLQELRIREFELELDTDTPYQSFQQRITRLKDAMTELLRSLKAQNKRIHLYGASTKGNVLLQWYQIDSRTVDCAADRNPEKTGAHTLGTNIPIVSEATSRAQKPDYYLVLPWHFKREFLERERETIAAGTKMIFPLPEIVVVDHNNLAEHLKAASAAQQHSLLARLAMPAIA
jgi:SAM-dependent methyltransferase